MPDTNIYAHDTFTVETATDLLHGNDRKKWKNPDGNEFWGSNECFAQRKHKWEKSRFKKYFSSSQQMESSSNLISVKNIDPN